MRFSCQRGNIMFMVLIAIVLVGALTVAIRGMSPGKDSISDEDLSIQASQLAQYGAELEQAVRYVIDNGASETEIRFAAPSAHSDYGTISTTPTYQIFSRQGGNATFRLAPTQILNGVSRTWEFYGTTDLPGVGSNKADLVAVVPDVTQAFCEKANRNAGFTGQPVDDVTGATPDCIDSGSASRFGNAGANFDTSPNTVDAATFSKTPALQGCVQCGAGAYHYFYVLLAR